MTLPQPSDGDSPLPPSPYASPAYEASLGEASSDIAVSQRDDACGADRPWHQREPAWWLFLVVLTSFLVFVGVSIVTAVTAEIAARATFASAAEGAAGGVHDSALHRSPLLFCLTVIIPQLAMVVPALVVVWLLAESVRRRLGFVRGHWPLWLWIPAAMGTLTVAMASGFMVQYVVQPFWGESQSLGQMSELFRSLGQGGRMLPLALVIGITPGIFEELLFRGYLQTGLTRRWGPLAGVSAASFAFAIFHVDPVHAAGVLLIGVYLGWVYWASGSLFPAMLGHFFNNFFSVMAIVAIPQVNAGGVTAEITADQVTWQMALLLLVVLASFGALLLTLAAAVYYRRAHSG